jgi:2-polyprenyl-3-methyl-5-hydroxy-6-metoxy-1,4-benzoquinol methylase
MNGEWPAQDLEILGRCLICGSDQRRLAFEGVTDRLFGSPGSWNLHRCACEILYLDPRPNARSIHRAYSDYHTHHIAERELPWRANGFRGAVRRGYLNSRYGYRMPHASLVGALTWRFRRPAVKNLDFMIRHLGPPASPGSKILDVGCGNGDFLRIAEDLGYVAVGIDPDQRAVELAGARGLSAQSGLLPGSGQQADSFVHVFLSHVLEHLHQPREALEEVLTLLAPGGRLWISQPNLDASGLAHFGKHWRGLEPPRHLSLYSPRRLAALLGEVGYEEMSLLPAEEAALFYYRQSQSIKCGSDPYDGTDPPGWRPEVISAALAANRRARSHAGLGESLTMVAWKSG